MGTSRSTAEFAAKLGRMADSVAKLPADTARPNADTAAKVIGDAVNSMSGGDGRLSGAGPVGVNTTVVGGAVLVSPRGPVHLVENPIGPHEIGADGARLRLGNRWVTGPVRHRGTRGKGQWSRARDGVLPAQVADNTAKAMHTTTTRTFG